VRPLWNQWPNEVRGLTHSSMEEAWVAAPNRAELTSWRPVYIQKFLRQLGSDYDFLFSQHSAEFVPNTRAYQHGVDWAVVTLQAGRVWLQFIRDRGDIGLMIAPSNETGRWFPAKDLCLLAMMEDGPNSDESQVRRVQLPPIPRAFREHFSAIEELLSPQRIERTQIELSKVMKMRTAGMLDVFNVRPDPGFLANYAQVSDDISRVPFWKPLGIYAGMILLSPLLLLFLVFGMPFLWFLKQRNKSRMRVVRR